jgi:hypothetical protein
MKTNNPVWNPEVKARIVTALRAKGWPASVPRGGNGRGPTQPQMLLACALGWPMEVAVSTMRTNDPAVPNAYKIDIANPTLKVAIEVDGNSHKTAKRRVEDAKKDRVLCGLGWTVLRFWNEAVMADLNACVQTVLSTISKSSGTTTM